MVFLKIVNKKLIGAPEIIERNGKIVYGYNQETNEPMLIADGFIKFPKTYADYEVKRGQIVEKEIISPEYSIFTKLQIRRAMRQLGIEDQLDNILENNPQFKKEWDDCIEVDLNDQMIKDAINAGLITQEVIDQIKNII